MRYISVCSGIEAATVAWHPLGWEPAFFSEIDKFPSELLAWHYPSVPNRGDMTKFKEWPAGGGRDFGSILGGMVELGYGIAYRVLDAQFCRTLGFAGAVPQRRRRVIVVGYLGDWRRAAAVLFDGASLRGDPAPRREAGQNAAPTLSARTKGGGGLGTDFDLDGGQTAVAFGGNDTRGAIEVATARNGHAGPHGRLDFETETFVAQPISAFPGRMSGTQYGATEDGSSPSIGAINPIAIAFDTTQITHPENRSNPQPGDPSHPIPAHGHAPAVAFSIMPMNSGKDYKARETDVAQPVMAGGPSVGNQGGDDIAAGWAVRRLTPLECERLQGFPDGYTQIPRGNKPAADGPRYKALGNSMAVNVMRILGQRIALIDGQ